MEFENQTQGLAYLGGCKPNVGFGVPWEWYTKCGMWGTLEFVNQTRGLVTLRVVNQIGYYFQQSYFQPASYEEGMCVFL